MVPALSRDGKQLATATKAFDIHVHDTGTGQLHAVALGHAGKVRSLCFGPQGDLLASASDDGTIRIWEAATGRQIVSYEGGSAGSLTFSPDGLRIAAVSVEGIQICGVREHAQQILAGFVEPGSVVFSRDGTQIAVGSLTGQVHLVSLDEPDRGVVLGPHRSGVDRIVYSADGRMILTVASSPWWRNGARKQSDGKERRILDKPEETACYLWTSDGQLRHSFDGGALVTAGAFSDDGKTVFTGSKDGVVRVWDVATGILREGIVNAEVGGEPVWAIAANVNGTQVASCGWSGKVTIHDPSTGKVLAGLAGHKKRIDWLQFSPDGESLFTSSRDGTVRKWRAHDRGGVPRLFSNKVVGRVSQSGDRVLVLARDGSEIVLGELPDAKVLLALKPRTKFSGAELSDAASLLVTLDGEVVEVRDAMTGELRKSFKVGAEFSSLGVSEDGKQIFLTDQKIGLAQRWSLESGTNEKSIEAGECRHLSFSPDGRRLFAMTRDGVRLWNVDTAEDLTDLSSSGSANGRFSPDGQFLAVWPYTYANPKTGVVDRFYLRLWDVEKGEMRSEIPAHRDSIRQIQIDPSGQFLVTSSRDQTAKLWSCPGGELVAELIGHSGPVVQCAVSRGGERVLTTCSDDGSTRLWDGKTGEQIAIIGQSEQRVRGFEFSSSGRFITTTLRDESDAAIWAAHSGELITHLPEGHTSIAHAQMSEDEQWVITTSAAGEVLLWPVAIAEHARKFVPRELHPLERELFGVGTPAERKTKIGRWHLRRPLAVLELLPRGVENEGDSRERIRPSYHRLLLEVGAAVSMLEDPTQAGDLGVLLDVLEHLGGDDARAHFLTARALLEVDRSAALRVIEQGLALSAASDEERVQLQSLKDGR